MHVYHATPDLLDADAFATAATRDSHRDSHCLAFSLDPHHCDYLGTHAIRHTSRVLWASPCVILFRSDLLFSPSWLLLPLATRIATRIVSPSALARTLWSPRHARYRHALTRAPDVTLGLFGLFRFYLLTFLCHIRHLRLALVSPCSHWLSSRGCLSGGHARSACWLMTSRGSHSVSSFSHNPSFAVAAARDTCLGLFFPWPAHCWPLGTYACVCPCSSHTHALDVLRLQTLSCLSTPL